MKNALISGIVIGALSALWLFILLWTGVTTTKGQTSGFEYGVVIIPVAGVFLGVLSYKKNEKHNEINFFEALLQCFKILLVAGFLAGFLGIMYVNFFGSKNGSQDFSGRLFGALLVGVIVSLGVSVILMSRSSRID
ncbi:DUF4199 domain-containing protein [Mucilaginibacter corticis]|uniref:DUF4199 domain-containing protein n=1 Tax=Mucilaginibacter corticis TaxID=2597670 RepID=A0A556M917_9SPHI|nr:DUF4199 domain-containing protein [Mucilaginibacter corticis]TSJ36326.1 DUF4199 domain-containing protein [Mucilaginibacter corticis]